MFRWLKGSKNRRKRNNSDDKYGFHDQTMQYGFRKNKGCESLDSSLHIYDEISEVPEISFSRQFTLLPEETNIGKNVEGPYLVVPILPSRRSSDKNVEHLEESKSSSDNSNLSSKKRVYNEPWDMSPEELSEHQLDTLVHPAYRDSDSGYTCNSISNRTDSERISGSDTGCEYDMSTESDVSSEYKELINKMQNNLALKHQILKMIKETETGKDKHTETLKKTSTSSLDSAEFLRSRDAHDNDDGSECSSGFDDCETSVNTTSENIEYDTPSFSKCDKRDYGTACVQLLRKKEVCLSKNIWNPCALGRNRSNHSNENVTRELNNEKPNVKRNSWTGFVPKETNIYSNQNWKRKTSSNRLLGDLINMNHNIQTLKF